MSRATKGHHVITIALFITNSLTHCFKKLSLLTKCRHAHLTKYVAKKEQLDLQT